MWNDLINEASFDINIPKQLDNSDILKISDKAYVSSTLYEKRGNKFYDVVFVNNEKEYFIGRFINKEQPIKIGYNNGKILIYLDSFNNEIKKMVITKVISLYDILNDITYACTEEEALNLFDESISTEHLKNKDSLIIRNDVEKRNRLKLT